MLLERVVRRALEEDLGHGDLTTTAICPPDEKGPARILCKEEAILSGIEVVEMVYRLLDPRVELQALAQDGDRITPGEVVVRLSGPLASILQGERTALNFLQLLSGIATRTARYVELVRGFPVRIVDTRKTLPGLRALQKYAVRVGGGGNHRFGLSDGVLIKENHIAVAGGLKEAVRRARSMLPLLTKVEVEVQDLEQVKEALKAEADAILLDNMRIEDIKGAVALVDGRMLVEVSGNITEANIRQVAATGVDIISLGTLTKDVEAVDFSLLVEGL